MTLSPLGDSAVIMTLSGNLDETLAARVHALAAEIDRHRPAVVCDVIPAFASVAVFYDPARLGDYDAFRDTLKALAERADASVVSDRMREIEIPVRYGGEYGPDLEACASLHGLAPDELVGLHAGAAYFVHAIGFVPGFPYLGGLPEKLATPRRPTPRPRVPAGSVGIGGAQTGIYPFETPGGWNLLGRTPLRLFDVTRDPPALLRAGDRVRFRAISEMEFRAREQSEIETAADVARTAAAVASPPAVEVVRPGMFTTVQDLGRAGRRADGVPLSGAMDTFALRVANMLVGNPPDAAALEFTLAGPELRFLHDTIVALGGAEFEGVPRWQPIPISAGTTLKLGAARHGCRGYLAIAGGIDVAPVLHSRSTYVRARLGGCSGRALIAGDRLRVPEIVPRVRGRWHIDDRILPDYAANVTLRVLAGAQADEHSAHWRDQAFKVSSQSDRMGVRLNGPAIARRDGADLTSSPVAPGTVQVPPDGQPIILAADAQTIGGYPQLAHVIAVDLPLVAQLRPGDVVRFRDVSLAEAHQLALGREHALAMLHEGLAEKVGGNG